MLARPISFAALIGGLFTSLSAQPDSLALRYAATITMDELREHLTVLASDAYMGRDTGKEGQKKAASYLKGVFVEAGIPPVPAQDTSSIQEGYFQRFGLIEERMGGIRIEAAGRTYLYGKEIAYFNEVLTSDMNVTEVVHLGDAKELPGSKLGGSTVLMDAAGMGLGAEAWGLIRSRSESLRNAGAALILVSVPSLVNLLEGVHLPASNMRLADGVKKEPGSGRGVQMILVDEAAMNTMLGTTTMAKLRKKRTGKRVRLNVMVKREPLSQQVSAENVLAFIEGSDRKEEVVVLTAHYDHIGVEDGVVYNGADDDGTGTVAMIEIAEAFAMAKAAGHGPRRSVLVMPVSGEEKGLLGSRYYSEHPVFPLENTVADLNIDMIGRVDSAHTSSPPYIYVIGSDRLSSELHTVNEQANSAYTGLLLDYTFNAESDPNRFYYRSDHYNFARKGVPSIFYFSGVHEDYHQPGDDVEKIRFDLLKQRTLLVFHTAWILANQEHRIRVDKPLKP